MLTAYKRCHWFNSDFHSGFLLNDNQKISEISFDVNPFQIDVNNNLKVITYVRDATQSRPIQIKLKLPYNQSREVFNDDNEAFPIIYTNHTGVEGMNTYYPYSVARLVPQQIPRFTFRVDDNYNMVIKNSYFTSLTNGEVLPIAMGTPTEKYVIFRNSGSFTLTDKMVVDILVVGGGGSGGSRHGGGGGAGAVIYLTNQTLNSGSYTITIGAGGGAVNIGGGTAFVAGNAGQDTTVVLGSTTIYKARGGGFGHWYQNVGGTGGSGGGSGGDYQTTATNVATDNIPSGAYGNIGGKGSLGGEATVYGGGGGGGAGSAGGNANQTAVPAIGGNGGNGREITITGANIYYGGGGGGGIASDGNSAGTGGLGGGGGGSKGAVKATNGIANTGGGGGGAGFISGTSTCGESGAGGSGVVIIRYREERNRIEGITPEETLIQATNTNIPITIDSQYQINYQTPVVLPKGTYETIFNNGAITFKSKPDYSYPILKNADGSAINPFIWYKFDSDTGLLLDSGTSVNNLTNNGVTLDSTNYVKGNNSISFSGTTNNYATINNNINFYTIQTTSGITVSLWAKMNSSTAPAGRLFHFSDATQSVNGLYCISRNGATNNLFFQLYSGSTTAYATSGVNYFNDTWTHIVWSISTSGVWAIYINGAYINPNFTINFPSQANSYTARRLGNGIFNEFLKGNLDDLRWYSRVLTPTQVYELYNGSSDRSYPILKDVNGGTINPRNWYKFDTDSLLLDSGSSPINLTAINIAPTADTSNFVKGNSSSLNTTNITTPNYLRAGVNLTPPFSISFWLNMNSLVDNAFIGLANNTSGSSPLISCQFSTSDNKITSYICAPVLWTILPSSATITSSTWYHYVLTITSGNPASCVAYLNGALTGSLNGTGAFVDNGGVNQLFINIRGDLYPGSNFGGYIDDFRIYSQVLTATQVAELYNGRLAIYNPPGFILGTEIEPEA